MPQSTRPGPSPRTEQPQEEQNVAGLMSIPASSPNNGTLPVFSDDQIVQWLRTQWDGSSEGSTRSTSTQTYYIGGSPYASGSAEAGWKVEMTALMKSRAALAFELWDDLIGINLMQVTSPYERSIQFEYASHTQGGGSYSIPWISRDGTSPYRTPDYAIQRTEIWLNSGWSTHDTDADMYFGGYGFETYMHEIGHSLGLSHPGSYDEGSSTSITYGNDAEFAQDNRRYTIMSYFGGYQPNAGWQQDGTNPNWLYSSTPMLYDVLAIQAIYGADHNTRRTNTVYGFNSTADRDVYDFTKNTHPILTIWDGGGIDTLNTSGFGTKQRINLNAGTYSDVGGLKQNLAIAFGAVIENAVGGSANDTIVGNSADNKLTGGAGDDVINGGDGVDSAIFSKPFAQYTLTTLSNNSMRIVGPDGTDTITNVEKLVFSDRTMNSPYAKLVSISDARVTEGNNGARVAVFTVTRTGASGAFSVDYATADSSATIIDGDYVAVAGRLSFDAGVNSRTIAVRINGDTKIETDETVLVDLSNPTDAAMITDGRGFGEIINDDFPVGSVKIDDYFWAYEGSAALFYCDTHRRNGSVHSGLWHRRWDGDSGRRRLRGEIRHDLVRRRCQQPDNLGRD